jgi:hypothetical protein
VPILLTPSTLTLDFALKQYAHLDLQVNSDVEILCPTVVIAAALDPAQSPPRPFAQFWSLVVNNIAPVMANYSQEYIKVAEPDITPTPDDGGDDGDGDGGKKNNRLLVTILISVLAVAGGAALIIIVMIGCDKQSHNPRAPTPTEKSSLIALAPTQSAAPPLYDSIYESCNLDADLSPSASGETIGAAAPAPRPRHDPGPGHDLSDFVA